jgi:hypothetical protein
VGFFDSARAGAADDAAITAMTEAKPKRRLLARSIDGQFGLTLKGAVLAKNN